MSDSPAMISAPRLCPQCGAEIPSDAPEGGCPCCLLHVGLLPDAQVAARDASTITATEADQNGSAEKVAANAGGCFTAWVPLESSISAWAGTKSLARMPALVKPTAPPRNKFSVFATTPCRGLSLSR
jgi:hypothetical protein